MVHTHIPSTQDIKAGGSEVCGYPWLDNSKFGSSLKYMRPAFLKNETGVWQTACILDHWQGTASYFHG